MTLILPDDLASFEKKLTASQLGRIIAALEIERRDTCMTEGRLARAAEPR